MNKYRIQKIVFANSLKEADEIVSGGETSYIELIEDENNNKKIGFQNGYDEK